MSFLMLVIIVGCGAWFVHWKFKFSWGSIWTSIGTVAFLLVRWAFSQEQEQHRKVSERVRRMSTYSNEELKEHANNFNYSPQERSSATREMKRRRENGTVPF
ncbi:hypothetical protein [Levilactobacillus brevis]|uniref:hypothetical protein n=1 Tax=Levilactobacillus brevis TaxID=1580 RepID=UPI001BDE67C6|nr:hypothetical protein [Levilactobacillus brevis]